MQHELALSIYQELQILSRYLKDAAFKKGWEPYVVRAQVSVSPFAHYQPFDVYVDLGLFTSCLKANNHPVRVRHAWNPASGDYSSQAGTQAAMVIPLLVTDAIEAQQASNTAELARDLALGLGGNIGGVALQGSMEKISKNIQSILGTDYNSLYMISRVSDNVMQVRLGAPANAMSQYSMSTVTHNVTMVVLAPPCPASTDHTQLDVATVSHLRDAVSGKVLDADAGYGIQQARKVLVRFYPEEFSTSQTNTPQVIQSLLGPVKDDNYQDFLKALDAAHLSTATSLALWTALGDVGGTSEFNVAYIDLPSVRKGSLTPSDQMIYITDDGTTSTATINVDPDLTPVKQSARLLLGSNPGIILLASAVNSINDGRTLQIQFPSLTPLKALPGDIVPKKAGNLKGELILEPAVERWNNNAKSASQANQADASNTPGYAPLNDYYDFKSLLYMPAPAVPKGNSTPVANTPGRHATIKKKVVVSPPQPVSITQAPLPNPALNNPPAAAPSPGQQQHENGAAHHGGQRKPDQAASAK
ncbi:hypothetical protein LFL96_22275 [Paraburkholderia sp. D15]|uniref:hypothetical protein n=1 Tax=Paraburkholderia sp. D15 TaxID=2880218 RepID=UPI0024786F4F|nr:hypothetical protein [Paraburkholderia sp. D15]WGS53775.1 hypothetical protein LFL96_22275 [Paraburkholderia sp. D15]